MHADVVQHHNCPFEQLPVELIIKIFCLLRAALVDTSGTSNLNSENALVNDRIYCLRQVCRAWMHIITNSPQIWTTYNLYRTDAFRLREKSYWKIIKRLPLHLKLSQNAPLNVVLGIQRTKSTFAAKQFTSYMRVLSAESHRWDSLTLTLLYATCLADIRTRWSIPITRLKELRIWLPRSPLNRIVLHSSDAPLLKKVILVYSAEFVKENMEVILPWSQLSDLRVRGAKGSSYAYIMSALNHSPHLKRLVFREGDLYPLSLHIDISLPHLVELDLLNIHTLIKFIGRLPNLPALETIAFSIVDTRSGNYNRASADIRHFSQFLATCDHLSSIRLQFTPSEEVKEDFDILFASTPNLRNLSLSIEYPYFDKDRQSQISANAIMHASADIIIALLTAEPSQLILVLPYLTSIVLVDFAITPFSLCQMIYSRSSVYPRATKLRNVQVRLCTPYSRVDLQKELRTGSLEVQLMMLDVANFIEHYGMWVEVTFTKRAVGPEIGPEQEKYRDKYWSKKLQKIEEREEAKWWRDRDVDREELFETSMLHFRGLTEPLEDVGI